MNYRAMDYRIQDREVYRALDALGRKHNELAEQVLGLTALVGAMSETAPLPTPDRLREWSQAVARKSLAATSSFAVQNQAMALLKALEAGRTPIEEKTQAQG